MLLDKISHLTANDIDLKQLLSRQVGFIIIVSSHSSYFHHNEHNHEAQLISCNIVIITTLIVIVRLTAKASLSTLGRTPQEIFYSWR